MAPGSRWKSSVNELNQGFDNVRRHIDTLTKMDDMKKTVYSNPTTQVDIVVKSKKPKNQESWSSVLSSGNPEKQATNSRPLRKKATKKAIKDQVDSKKQAPVAQQQQQLAASQHKFSSRTLQIFLKEMRLALKHQNAKIQVEKILDDLEYVAANLDPEQPLNNEGQGVKQPNYDLALHKAELKKSKSDNEVLKRNVLILENKVHELEHDLKANVKKVSQYKSYVSELSSNGNEMLNLLHSKAKEDVDDKVASLEKSNFKLQKELSQERLKTSSLELKLKKVDFENSKLKKVIEYVLLFYSLLSNLLFFFFVIFQNFENDGYAKLAEF